jgi:hypothetical protein
VADFRLARLVVTLPELTASRRHGSIGQPRQRRTGLDNHRHAQFAAAGTGAGLFPVDVSLSECPAQSVRDLHPGLPDRPNGLQIDEATNNDLAGYAGGTGVEIPGTPTGIRTLSVGKTSPSAQAAAP